MKITIPKQASGIIDTLRAHSYEAYVVGGCVRDSILGRTPSDWDITTSALPQEVKALFPRTIDTGIKHGTVTILIDKVGFEVTTYRVDGVYADHRRPNDVTFTASLREDLQRRDFTINAMAYNDVDGLVDLFGGVRDLEAHVIRCVGEPAERFDEDALRMLRAVRFAAQLDFSIEERTRAAILAKRQFLADVSAERIQMELLKLLISDHPEALRTAYETGLTGIFLPEFDRMMDTAQHNPHHRYTVGEHTLHAVCHIAPNPILRLTMLLHDIAKPETKSTDAEGIDHFYNHNAVGAALAEKILRRLKFDNRTTRMVATLIAHHDIRFEEPLGAGRAHVRRVIHAVGAPLFPYLLDVMEADISAQSDFLRERKFRILAETRAAYDEILANGDCLSLKELKINGKDLKALGILEGKKIGAILNALLSMVLEEPQLNQYAVLEELAREVNRNLDETFYSEENRAELERRIRNVQSGKSTLKAHGLIEVD